jgi:hypothetical protein
MKGVSKKSGFNIQILKVESEWPVTTYDLSIMQLDNTWWLVCLLVSNAPIALILGW